MQKSFKKIITRLIQSFLSIYLNVVFVFVAYKHKKSYLNKNKLLAVTSISEVDKKGGAAMLAYRLHKKLQKSGVDSKIIAGLITSPEENIHPISVSEQGMSNLMHRLDTKFRFYDFLTSASFGVINFDAFKDADIVHLHNLHVNYFNKLVLPKISAVKPTIWTLHDTLDLFEDYPDSNSVSGELQTYPDLSTRRRLFFRNLSRKIVENSHIMVVTPSEWLRKKAKRGIFKDKEVHLIYNGVDESVFKQYDKASVREELGLPLDKTILLFSAAWGLAEGTKDSRATLLAMYKELSYDPNIVFAILGGGGEDFMAENTVTISYISDQFLLAKYYSSADLFIYPSLWDNCPLTVIENMAVGTPVITYNTGGIPELVTHMETGYIAKYNDSQDFIKGVKLFLDNTELRNSAANQSTKVFKERFTLDTMVKKYISLYTEMLKQ